MKNFIVKKFPLTKDLTPVTGFLRERGIQHQIYEEAGEQVIAVNDARMVAPINQFLQDIENGHLVIEQDAVTDIDPPLASSSPTFLDKFLSTPITSTLIIFSILGAILVGLDNDYVFIRWFSYQDIDQHAIQSASSLIPHQLWRVITPVFLHFGFAHVLFNSLWMWDLGRRLELLMGRGLYLLLFVVTASLSNIAQYWWAADTLFGGMSGVVYALVGYILVRHKFAPHPLTAVPASVLGFMLFWLVLCMTGALDYFIGGGVANAAHLGGLLAGCVFALLSVKQTSK